ncbi:hypothetical protein ACQKOE_07810 [Novosphingobium sp. NPDC080210]|uniref:hypothetical protein n=1 Tax=Novosphingobium sp. NPDC080210 TaxID=3390596 RepID=UPI003CFE59D6
MDDNERNVIDFFSGDVLEEGEQAGIDNELLDADRRATIETLESVIEDVRAGLIIGCVVIAGRYDEDELAITGIEVSCAEPIVMAPLLFLAGTEIARRRVHDLIEQMGEA